MSEIPGDRAEITPPERDKLELTFFENFLLPDITPAMLERYRVPEPSTPSAGKPSEAPSPDPETPTATSK